MALYDSVRNCIRRGRLRWFGHVERCSIDRVMKKCRDIELEGKQKKKGGPRKTCHQVMDSDIRYPKLDHDLAQIGSC